MNHSVLFSLISRQAMANVIPALQLQPARTLLFTTKEEEITAHLIADLLRKRGLFVEISTSRISAYNGVDVSTAIRAELEKLHPEEIPILNATGGTKIMAFAAFQVFIEHKHQILYCNTAEEQLMTLFPTSTKQKISISLSIREYLSVHGFSIKSIKHMQVNEEESTFYRSAVIPRISDFEKFYNIVRDRKLHERRTSQANKFSFEYRKKEEHVTLIDHRTKLEAHFINYHHGQWLEDVTFLKVSDSQPDDILCGVQIQSEHGAKNELDVVASYNGQLILISCKTGKLDNMDVHQLLSLKNLTGGTFGKGVVVLPRPLKNAFSSLAIDFGVTLLTPDLLSHTKFFTTRA